MLGSCRACDSKRLKLLKSIKKIPLYIWPVKIYKKNNLNDLKIYLCKNCGQIQIQKIPNHKLKNIYAGKTFNFDNQKQILERIKLIKKNNHRFNEKKMLEIGGGTNSIFSEINEGEKWISDYKINNNIENKINKFIKGDFLKKNIKVKFDYIFMFHVLEHLENTTLYIQKVKKTLKQKGSLFVEVPNFHYESQYLPFYAFFHMHITIFHEKSLIAIMNRSGLYLQKKLKISNVLFFEFKISKNKLFFYNHCKLSTHLIKKYENSMLKLKEKFLNIGKNKISFFGAGGSTNLFVHNFYFINSLIVNIFDNDKQKHNKFLVNNKILIEKISLKKLRFSDILVLLEKNHLHYLPAKIKNEIIIIENLLNDSR